jgi:DNA-directed RNA polymerase specialized sigma24 family protein
VNHGGQIFSRHEADTDHFKSETDDKKRGDHPHAMIVQMSVGSRSVAAQEERRGVSRPRKPMPELSEALSVVTHAAEELRTAEDALEQARERFRQALTDAHKAGASYGLLGRLVGLSRQRVAVLIGGKTNRQ